jgi:glycosyltransferase involved in cell wall biosynthesis
MGIRVNTGPIVSVITPVYNGARFLEETIASVQSQHYPLVEHIVIDDGSTDGGATVEILKRHPHLRWWSRPNKGQYATMNEGLVASKGDIVLFLCADDVLVPPKSISRAVAHLTRHSKCDAVYGRWQNMDEHGQLPPIQPQLTGRYPKQLFAYVPFISHCALFVRRSVLTDDLLFDPTMRYVADVDWIQRLFRAGTRLCYVDTVMARYRVHTSQTTQSARTAKDTEHLIYLDKYDASPRLYRVINEVLAWRANVLFAVYIWRRDGLRTVLRRAWGWRQRRLALRRGQ